MRRTKIICTLGPKTSSEEAILGMVRSGMNVCRLNFSHGSHDYYKGVIQSIVKARKSIQTPLAILMDTKGPEMRLGHFEGILELKKGQRWFLVSKKLSSSDLEVFPSSIIEELEPGLDIYIDDGKIHTKVISVSEGRACIEVQNKGQISSKKSVNIPKGNISLPLITEKDIQDITFAVEMGVDYIAASFVCHEDQVFAIRALLKKLKKPEIRIISKIESQSGIDHFDAILEASDGIMIARGDLGVEVKFASIPRLQKMMIEKANLRGKISITATQMLESMVENPFPLRAEVSDVANSIYDASSAVMLSGETAVGKWPFKVIETMNEIILEAESDFGYDDFFSRMQKSSFNDVSSAIALSCVKICQHTSSTAIITTTYAGNTAIAVSRFHPRQSIIAVTPLDKTFHQMALVWGTVAMREKYQDLNKGLEHIACTSLQKKWVDYGDLVVISSGKPFGKSYTTNTIFVDSIGKVILRAKSLRTDLSMDSVKAKVYFHLSERVGERNVKGKIVCVYSLSETMLEDLQSASGIILQNAQSDPQSVELLHQFCQQYKIAGIYQADWASTLLNEGVEVILDPKKGLVFAADTISKEDMLLT